MNRRDLLLRIRALVARQRVERELDDELALHIELDTRKHIAAGLSPAAARARALARFGSMALAAEQCRDARGTAIVVDVIRDVRYAFRSFRRAPLAAATIVATVALGLGLVAVVFTLYNAFFLRADAVRHPGELVAVAQSDRPGGEPHPFTRADYDAMRRETDVFADIVAMRRPVRAHVDGRVVTGSLVTGNFFQALGAPAERGRPLVPADDRPVAGRPAIVLSHVGWDKLLARDPMVVGRSVTIDGKPYEVVGVMPAVFRGLGILPPDYWAVLDPASSAIEIVGRLKPGISTAAATAGLTRWMSQRINRRVVRVQPPIISLSPSDGTLPVNTFRSLLAFLPAFVVFGLVLAIGCANVTNLLLARGVSRQREIATRLALGAPRRRIIAQLLTESLLLALMAGAGGLVVSRLLLSGALHALTATVPPEILDVDLTRFVPPVADWRLLLFLVFAAVVSTAFFGLAPALQTTRLALVQTMRGEAIGHARPGRTRHVLIALQVGVSALLLICAVTFLRGSFMATARVPTVRTSDTVRISVGDESRRAALLDALARDPLVATIAASSRPASDVVATSMSADGTRISVGQLAVSAEYFSVLGVDIVRGRAFTPAERSADSGVVVVSETIARRLWPNGDGMGQTIRLETASPAPAASVPSSALTVVGIARDPAGQAGMTYLDTFRGVYVPAGPETARTWLMLRVRGNPDQVRNVLLDRLTSIDPGLDIITLRTMTGMQKYVLAVGFWITVVLGGLALALTVSGLFSVLSYVVEQQTKEIGVRMALGADTMSVVRLVLSQSLRPVSSGLAAGGGLALVLAIALTAASSEVGEWVRVFDPLAYTASALLIVSSCLLAVSVPALRAARIDPIATLRKD